MGRDRWEPDDELDDDYSQPDRGDGTRDEEDDEGWMGSEDDGTTTECPSCGEAMYDDSPRCSACGQYLSREDVAEKKPAWVMITVVVLLIAMLSWVVNFF